MEIDKIELEKLILNPKKFELIGLFSVSKMGMYDYSVLLKNSRKNILFTFSNKSFQVKKIEKFSFPPIDDNISFFIPNIEDKFVFQFDEEENSLNCVYFEVKFDKKVFIKLSKNLESTNFKTFITKIV